MTQIKLTLLNIPPFSINKAYYKRTFTRTSECREWGNAVLRSLLVYQAAIAEFRSKFNPKKHAIKLYIQYNRPPNRFFTNEGVISNRSMDLSNIEKPLIDLLFTPRYNGRTINETVINNINLDDRFITSLHSQKVPDAQNREFISVIVEIIDKPSM